MEVTKASADCWNICRSHATIMITTFPEQKRQTFICKYRNKRNYGQKYFKCCQHLRVIKSPEKILLCFLFSLIISLTNIVHTFRRLALLFSEGKQWFFFSWQIIHGKTSINVNGIRIWNHTLAVHPPVIRAAVTTYGRTAISRFLNFNFFKTILVS